MTAAVVLSALLAATYGLGYVVGRRRWEEDERDQWLPLERRRWRP